MKVKINTLFHVQFKEISIPTPGRSGIDRVKMAMFWDHMSTKDASL